MYLNLYILKVKLETIVIVSFRDRFFEIYKYFYTPLLIWFLNAEHQNCKRCQKPSIRGNGQTKDTQMKIATIQDTHLF